MFLMTNDYYVYVYIDPRNYEEFYYGKGHGSRKNAHLSDHDDTEKTRRISAIKRSGLTPIIRVIARNLSQDEALLVEKTLLWKLGRTFTNKSSGHFAKHFRPKNQMHKELYGFDFYNALYFFNVGETNKPDCRRLWDDCRKFGFLSAGGGSRYKSQIEDLEIGDIVIAYVSKFGYVGVGRVMKKAVPVLDAKTKLGENFRELPLLQKNLLVNGSNLNLCEYVALVDWIYTTPKESAKFRKNYGLASFRSVKASLQNQPKTISYIESEWGLDLKKELKESAKLFFQV